MLVGADDIIASFLGHFSTSLDFPDRWKSAGEPFEHIWEDRFVRDEGYSKIIPQTIAGLLKNCNLTIKDFGKIIFPGIFPRENADIAKRLGAAPSQIQPSFQETLGDTGSASPLLMLAAALDQSNPGDRILVLSFGSGCDALCFQVTEGISKIKTDGKHMQHLLSRRKDLTNYEKYLLFRNVLPGDVGIRGEEIQFSQMSTLWRDRGIVFALKGSRCMRCGTPQYPVQRVCVNPECGAIDEMEDYSFQNRKGTIFTFTADSLAASLDPPAIYGIVDFDGGGRFWFDFTDCDAQSLSVGLPVEMVLRRKCLDTARGQHVYFWFARPERS